MKGGFILPEVTHNTLDEIAQNEDAFKDFIGQHHRCLLWQLGCEPQFSEARLSDAYIAYCGDKSRLPLSLPNNKQPDHFKLAGILVFWLRRFACVYDIRLKNEVLFNSADERWKKIIKYQASEVLSFDLGLLICDAFQNPQADAPMVPKIDAEYYQYIGYMMKFKNLSPHAQAAIYKSLYIPLIPKE